MKKSFSIGDIVTLSENMKIACNNDKRYEYGIITHVGYWNIVDVKFCGISKDIGMRSDELTLLKKAE